MDNDKILEELSELMQLDYDAARAYEQALEKIDDRDIHHQISRFMNDHNRHVADLTNKIRDLGGTPPAHKPDIKGRLIEGVTSLRSATGTKGALEAMQMNEKITNRKYADAAALDYPEALRTLIENNYADEQRHLAYIESTLRLVTTSK